MVDKRTNKNNVIAALEYADAGFPVFPCHFIRDGKCSCGSADCTSAGKHPIPKDGLFSATTDVEKITKWWNANPQANIAIRTGESSGCWVLDLDGIEGIRDFSQLELNHPDLPEIPVSETGGGGRHFLFAYPEGGIKNSAKLQGNSIDVRGEGGYVIVEPSNHQSGNLYKWLQSPLKYDLLPAPDWLLSFARNGSSNGKPKSSPFTMGGDDFQSSSGSTKGNRHSELLKLVGSHIAAGDGPLEILKFAYEWADRCDPPHDHSDVERVVNDLCRRDRQNAESKPAEPIVFDIITSEELAGGDYRLEYLIEDMLVAGQPCIIAGPKKSLKTNVSIDLTLSLADGVPFLGKFDVARPTKVGLMSGESGAATIQETASRIAISKRRPLGANFKNAFWCFQVPQLCSEQHTTALREFVVSNGLEVLILDPVYLSMIGVSNAMGNLFAVGELLKPIAEIGQETGVTIVLVHHTKKGVVDPFEPPELEDIAWSGFQEFARQWFLLGRRKKYDPDQKGFHELWLNVGGSAGHSSLWGLDIAEGVRNDPHGRRWDVKVMFASEARQQATETKQGREQQARETKQQSQKEADRNTIFKVMETFPDGETKTVIRNLSGIRPDRFPAVFYEMVSKGEIVHYGKVKKDNGQEYDAYVISGSPVTPVTTSSDTGVNSVPSPVTTPPIYNRGVVVGGGGGDVTRPGVTGESGTGDDGEQFSRTKTGGIAF